MEVPQLGLELMPNDLRTLRIMEFKVCKLISINRFSVDAWFDVSWKRAELTFANFLSRVGLRDRNPNFQDFAMVGRCHDHREIDLMRDGATLCCRVRH